MEAGKWRLCIVFECHVTGYEDGNFAANAASIDRSGSGVGHNTRPFLLKTVNRGSNSRKVMYLDELHMKKGYNRREREVADKNAAKRRQNIASRTIVPSHFDDGEFAGWW